MKPTNKQSCVVALAVLGAAFESPAGAQEVLPRPEQPFRGKIGRIATESVKEFPRMVEAPKGAPNILLILTDDVGFGASSTFGGPIPTVTMDRLAGAGGLTGGCARQQGEAPTEACGSGPGWFYLVTAENRLREEGTKGWNSAGAERSNPFPCP